MSKKGDKTNEDNVELCSLVDEQQAEMRDSDTGD
jgi:hypothetical protein